MILPELPDTFHWTTEAWGAALRCRPLESIAPHLFTTRQLGLTHPADLQRLAVAVSAHEVAMVKQVHGAEVVVIRRGESRPEPDPTSGLSPASMRPEADVLVSNDPAIAIAVRAADCVPLLIADRITGSVAAVHVGWRGTAARAAVAAVNTLMQEFGARPNDLVAAIGPSIGPCCYEVGSELVDAFAAAGHERHLIDRWFVSRPPRRPFAFAYGGASAVEERESARRQPLHLDVGGANRDQLILAGMAEDQIHLAGLCTTMHLEVLSSYRAEGENAGRIAGVIRAAER